MAPGTNDPDVIDLRPAFKAVGRSKLKIALWAASVGGAAVAYTVLVPPVWKANTVLILPTQDATMVNPLLAAFSSNSDPIEILKGIVLSRSSIGAIARETNIEIKDLEEMIDVVPNKAANQMQISVFDGTKDRAIKINKLAIAQLARLSATTNLSVAERQAKLLEEAVTEKERDLRKSEDALVNFQKGAVTAPDPSTPFSGSTYVARLKEFDYELGKITKQLAVARAGAQRAAQPSTKLPTGLPESEKWRSRLVDLEYELRLAETQYGPQAPQVVKLKQEIVVTKGQLQEAISNYLKSIQQSVDPKIAELEASKVLLEWQRDYLKRMANAAPDEAVNFQRLLREVQTRGEVLRTVRTQYETAKLAAEVDRVRWSVLVHPYVEEKAVNKTLIKNAVIGVFLGIVIGILAAMVKFFRSQPAS